jgi:hypothetical protein
MRIVLIIMAIAGLAGCQQQPASSSFFPLESGHRWEYRTVTEYENNTIDRDKLVLSSHGSESLEEGNAYRRSSQSGVDYWLRSDETGIYRVATKSNLDEAPKKDPKPRYVLKEPLQVGTQWQATTTAYILQRNQEFPREIRHSHPSIPMLYTIEAIDQSVETPAGKFSNCLHIKGTATVKLYADPVVGWRDMPLTTQEWYCKGVGLVKLTREEIAKSTFLSGGTYTMELEQWQ